MSAESIPPASREREELHASPSDADLVVRALDGTDEAYRLLVDRYQRPVLGLIVRMVRDPALAEDLAQEAFIKAVRSLPSYDRERRFASWIFKIAHNTAIDHLRRGRTGMMSLESTEPDRVGPIDRLQSREVGQQEAAESHQAFAHLEAGLAELSLEYREIILLRFREGLSYEELAEVLEVPMGTVKTRLHRARKQLAERLSARGWDVG